MLGLSPQAFAALFAVGSGLLFFRALYWALGSIGNDSE